MILERLKSGRASRVLPEWRNETTAILAGGPSLTLGDVGSVKRAHAANRVRCIAVNDAYLLAPWADVCHAADVHWHRQQVAGVARGCLDMDAEAVRAAWSLFRGQKSCIEQSNGTLPHDDVHVLKNYHGKNHGVGLSDDDSALVTGRNSGFQALNMAVLAGAKRILLLGFDGAPTPDGKTHWHEGHRTPTPIAAYEYYRWAMSAAQQQLDDLNVEVINCSPGSRIDTFKKMSLGDVI